MLSFNYLNFYTLICYSRWIWNKKELMRDMKWCGIWIVVAVLSIWTIFALTTHNALNAINKKCKPQSDLLTPNLTNYNSNKTPSNPITLPRLELKTFKDLWFFFSCGKTKLFRPQSPNTRKKKFIIKYFWSITSFISKT